ncbi:MAG TPA: hypothetical protein VNF73_05390 [Candidatus Saccharimonadales bacterium]|nr:hypothetical protein [Candidatus Saccharimonadales bacterium]
MKDDDHAAETSAQSQPGAGAQGQRIGQPNAHAEPPPARRLDRAPGERYVQGPDRVATGAGRKVADRVTDTDPAPRPVPRGSVARGIVFGLAAAAFGLLVFEVLAGPLSFDTGLIVVALFTGRIVGLGVRTGARGSLSAVGRVALTLVITVVWLAAAETGDWLVAQAQGGVLPLGEYLIQTYGFQPVVQVAAALLAAGWSAR